MSNQEMQFADPDWKPSQQPGTNNNPQEQEVYTPQPINSDYREQNKWGSPPQQEGYTGLRPYTAPVPGQIQSGNYRQRPYSRRGRGLWFWIILAFIIISLISGGSRIGSGYGNGISMDHNPFNQKQFVEPTYNYPVNGQATIVINDQDGNVMVTEDPSISSVSIQSVFGNSFPGNPNDIQKDIIKSGNTITATMPNAVDLQVTVPAGANLNLNTGSGTISFVGTFGTTGTTQFQTTSGDITVTVPPSSAFHLDASTNSGSITNEFPDVNIQDNPSGSGQTVNGVVGGNAQSQGANVVIQSDSGDISLYQK